MAEPTDDEDQIFSGAQLGEDGRVNQGKPQPVPAPPGARKPAPPASPVLEEIFQQSMVPSSHFDQAPTPPSDSLELAERAPRPPPEFAPMPVPDRPVRPPSPEIHWFRWFLVFALLATVAGGVYIVTTARKTVDRLLAPGVLERLLPGNARPGPAGAGHSGAGSDSAASAERHVATPAPSLLVLSEPIGATVLIGGAVVGVTPWAGDNVWPKGKVRVEVRKAGYRSWETTVEGGVEQTVEVTLLRRK